MTTEKTMKDLFDAEYAIWDPFVKHYASQITIDQIDPFMTNLASTMQTWGQKPRFYQRDSGFRPITLVGLTKDKLGVFSRPSNGFPVYDFDTCEQLVVGLQRQQRHANKEHPFGHLSNEEQRSNWSLAINASTNLQKLIELGLDQAYVMRGRD